MAALQRVLGIDPGSRITGYGVIDGDGREARYRASGVIRLGDLAFPQRLRRILDELGAIVDTYQPQLAVIEQVFVQRNPASALKLGHARGAAICACVGRDLETTEYAARAIKQALTGRGGASKEQVQYMVQRLLSLDNALPEDAADALAVALCHVHSAALERRLQQQKA